MVGDMLPMMIYAECYNVIAVQMRYVTAFKEIACGKET